MAPLRDLMGRAARRLLSEKAPVFLRGASTNPAASAAGSALQAAAAAAAAQPAEEVTILTPFYLLLACFVRSFNVISDYATFARPNSSLRSPSGGCSLVAMKAQPFAIFFDHMALICHPCVLVCFCDACCGLLVINGPSVCVCVRLCVFLDKKHNFF